MKNIRIETKEKKWTQLKYLAVVFVVLVMMCGLFNHQFAITAHAQATGRANTVANIRREPSTSSEAIASTVEGREFTIAGSTTGSDGNVWYQIFVDSDTLGYVRSDLITVVSGSVPDQAVTGTPNANPDEADPIYVPDPGIGSEQGGFITVYPITAMSIGSSEVRVRSEPDGEIISIIGEGVELTIDGYITGSDGMIWYRAGFFNDSEHVVGYIRNDYVNLEGELQPLGEGLTEGGPEGDTIEGIVSSTPAYLPAGDYELDYNQEEDVWYLTDYKAGDSGQRYKVSELLESAFTNYELYEESLVTIRNQRFIIIILAVVVAGLGLAVTMLIFKIRDISDEAFISSVEKETMRNRGTRRPQGQGSAGSRSQGGGSQGRPGGQGSGSQGRPGGQVRPSGQGSGGQGRPGGQGSGGQVRPSGQGSGGQGRPSGQGSSGQVRPGGQGGGQVRPGQGGGQVRPNGQGSGGQARPVDQGGTQGRSDGQGSSGQARSANQGGSQARSNGQGDGGQIRGQERVAEQRESVQRSSASGQYAFEQPNPPWKSKNSMAEGEDEFEFEFLNWDGNEN